MKVNKRYEKLHSLERKFHHPLLHHFHKKHRISYKTLFYMKEYGTRSHAVHTIIRESLKIVLLAALISSIGGIHLEGIKEKIFVILPLLVMMPALNDMIGDFGTIVSSKFTTMLYRGRVKTDIFKSKEFVKLIKNIFSVALISSIYLGLVSYALAYIKGFEFDLAILEKVMLISVSSTIMLVSLVFIVSVASGIYVFKKKEDPNNFLVPISTAVADLGSMLFFVLLIGLMF